MNIKPGYPAICLAISLPILMVGVVQAQNTIKQDDATEINCKPGDDYPTSAIADYVLGCMAANGNTFESLHQCSCSIDLIKSRINYEDYEKITTIMSVQQDKGQRGIFFRDSNWAKNLVEKFNQVQAESTLTCF